MISKSSIVISMSSKKRFQKSPGLKAIQIMIREKQNLLYNVYIFLMRVFVKFVIFRRLVVKPHCSNVPHCFKQTHVLTGKQKRCSFKCAVKTMSLLVTPGTPARLANSTIRMHMGSANVAKVRWRSGRGRTRHFQSPSGSPPLSNTLECQDRMTPGARESLAAV